MNVAAIVITYNDDYKFNEWVSHHQEYKDELYKHIIVDNGSNAEYLTMVENAFPESIIIKRATNGGCTGAYNDGIKLALADPQTDAIMLIANDMKLESGGVTKLYSFLKSDPRFGMVEPVILEKDSLIVNDFGCDISKRLSMISYNAGNHLDELVDNFHIAKAVTGGMNMASRDFYISVGLQDENLFMYSDEVDMGIRAAKKGYLMAATKDTLAWHQHINANVQRNKRHPFSMYLIARNKVYLAKKHFGLKRALYIFLYFILFSLKLISILALKFRWNFIKDYVWSLLGSINGLIGNMNPNRYSAPDIK